MKKNFNVAIRIFGIFLIFILGVLVCEWVYSEIKFQMWLEQDERRLDFSAYDNPEELKEAILTRLPLGSSEQEVQAFRMAHGFVYRKPTNDSSDPFGVGMIVSQAGRGLFGLKPFILPYEAWGMFFILDLNDHTLIDIKVVSQGGII